MVQYQPFSVAGYEYPGWGIAIGWVIATLSIAAIPIGMVHAIATAEGKTIWQVNIGFYALRDYEMIIFNKSLLEIFLVLVRFLAITLKFITQTCPCNIQQYFTAVKMIIFR